MKKNQTLSIVALFAAYFLCYFIKLSPSVVMPVIQQEMNLSSSVVGFISGLYFFAYALPQFFIGHLCKRFTTHRLCAFGLLVCAVGLLFFGLAKGVVGLCIGRFLLGLGTSPYFIGLIYYLQDCFSGDKYVKVYGYSIFVSNVGSILASAPLAKLLTVVDRNMIFNLLAVIACLLGVFLFVLAKLAGEKGLKEEFSIITNLKRDFGLVFSNKLLICCLMFWFLQGAALISYQGLWCTKWTALAFPNFASYASFSGIFISIGVVISSYFCDKWRFKSRNKTMVFAGLLIVLSLLFTNLCKWNRQSVAGLCFSFMFDILYGYAGGNIIVQGAAFVREHSKTEDNANIMGVYNGLGCMVQQASQWISGLLIDIFAVYYTAKASFSMAYLCFFVVFLLVVLSCIKVFKRG